MTKDDLMRELREFGQRLSRYQDLCLTAGGCAAVGDITRGRQVGADINRTQDALVEWFAGRLVAAAVTPNGEGASDG